MGLWGWVWWGSMGRVPARENEAKAAIHTYPDDAARPRLAELVGNPLASTPEEGGVRLYDSTFQAASAFRNSAEMLQTINLTCSFGQGGGTAALNAARGHHGSRRQRRAGRKCWM
jgi:hypothetical protein